MLIITREKLVSVIYKEEEYDQFEIKGELFVVYKNDLTVGIYPMKTIESIERKLK